MKPILTNSVLIPIDLVDPNDGQIEGLPKNPRLIRDEKFEALKKSIEENPEMLGYREMLVYPFNGRYVAIGGNMRYAAMKELGYSEVPCKVLPENTTPKDLRAYVMKDNYGYGEWDMGILNEEWDLSELDDWGMDDIITFDMGDESIEEDFSGKNKEIDADEFDEKMTIKLQFSVDEHRFVREVLSKVDANIETALLKTLGYES